jgi:hypothetical protein
VRAADRNGFSPWWKRIGWLVLLWLLGVAAVAAVAVVLKVFMRLAGLTA